jgi:mannose-1-phosphate guanylyltransferase
MHCRQTVNIQDKSRWAVILAGGEGTRLRSLTRVIAGDERPKQFCTVLGNETLLQQTARRVAHVVRPSGSLLRSWGVGR